MAKDNSLNWILGIGSVLGAAAQVYSGYQATQAANKQADAARAQAAATREAALQQVKQMQAEAAQRSQQFQQQIEQSRLQTTQAAESAKMAQQTAMQQIAQQKSQSALAIQQGQLQAAIQRQQGVSNVGSPVRRRVGTPAALRTSLEIQSPLTAGASGMGVGASTATGGLNV